MFEKESTHNWKELALSINFDRDYLKGLSDIQALNIKELEGIIQDLTIDLRFNKILCAKLEDDVQELIDHIEKEEEE